MAANPAANASAGRMIRTAQYTSGIVAVDIKRASN